MRLGRSSGGTVRSEPNLAAILPPARTTMKDLPKMSAYLALFSEIGVVLFVTTLVGALAGHWLDVQLGTNPVFAVGGFLVGAAMGAVADYRLISRFLTRF